MPLSILFHSCALETLTAYFQACQLYGNLGKPNYAGQNFNPIRLNYSGWGNNLESLVMVE